MTTKTMQGNSAAAWARELIDQMSTDDVQEIRSTGSAAGWREGISMMDWDVETYGPRPATADVLAEIERVLLAPPTATAPADVEPADVEPADRFVPRKAEGTCPVCDAPAGAACVDGEGRAYPAGYRHAREE
jgi:hypothetical protein